MASYDNLVQEKLKSSLKDTIKRYNDKADKTSLDFKFNNLNIFAYVCQLNNYEKNLMDEKKT